MFLHLDEALIGQERFRSAVLEAGGYEVDARPLGPWLRLWARPPALAQLDRCLVAAPTAGPELVFTGSGDFHHVTLALLRRALRATPGSATLVHFDNHPDWVRFRRGLHCGSWVAQAAALSEIARIITIGPCSADVAPHRQRFACLEMIASGKLELYPWRDPDGLADAVYVSGRQFKTIEGQGEAAFLDRLLTLVPTNNVYVTIDKDALRAEEAVTNWDQGAVSLAFLEAALRRLAAGRRIIGADTMGDWSRPVYAGWEALAKHAEAWIDHPRARHDEAAATALNEAANLRLLAVLGPVS